MDLSPTSQTHRSLIKDSLCLGPWASCGSCGSARVLATFPNPKLFETDNRGCFSVRLFLGALKSTLLDSSWSWSSLAPIRGHLAATSATGQSGSQLRAV
eukprot:7070302-Pyramimonas_sp.AAC.1